MPSTPNTRNKNTVNNMNDVLLSPHQYGRGKRTRNPKLQIDYKRLAGEAYSYDSSEENNHHNHSIIETDDQKEGYDPNHNHNHHNVNNSFNYNTVPVTVKNNDKYKSKNNMEEHDYANKHVPQVLYRTYDNDFTNNNKNDSSKKDMIQIIHDGSQLTLHNFIDPNHSLNIHKPIIVKDTATSIGMKVPKGKRKRNFKGKKEISSLSLITPIITNNNNTVNADVITSNNDNSNTNEYEYEPITIREIGEMIGMKHQVSVMDVKTQDEMEGWCMTDLVDYWEDEDRLYQLQCQNQQQHSDNIIQNKNNDSHNKTNYDCHLPSSSSRRRFKKSSKPRVLNQISLEFSHTKLRKYTLSPSFVRDIDWIDNVWPRNKRSTNDYYPRVQYYCLTSTAGCYTDFHIDFGGTSVWYHVLSGKKVFLLIPPTSNNVKLYETWLCSKHQGDIFFPDMTIEVDVATSEESETLKMKKNVKKDGSEEGERAREENQSIIDYENGTKKLLRVESCIKVTLEQNQTFIIPTGWIHAVYTPIDSIVIGGNFLHGFDIKGQLDIHCLETRTRVPAKFRFPYFVQLMFYAGKEYFKRMFDPNGVLYQEELDGIVLLSQALRTWTVHSGGDADREGSIAYVMRECVNDLQSHYNITSFGMMLDLLEAEVKRIKEDGIDKKFLLHISAPSSSHHSNGPYKGASTKLKLTLKQKSPTKDTRTAEEANFMDDGNCTNNETMATIKNKRFKIGDLASKHSQNDEEWLPGKSKTKNRSKTSKALKKKCYNDAVINDGNINNCNEATGIKCRQKAQSKLQSNGKDSQMKQGSVNRGVKSRLKKKLGF